MWRQNTDRRPHESGRVEIAEAGITANSICPGFVLTPLVEKQIDDLVQARRLPRDNVIRNVILASQPTKQFVKLEDVAETALFLASNAASQVNGASLSIEAGGQHGDGPP